MKKFKYIIVNDYVPIIFHEALTHSHIINNPDITPTSAGFCIFEGGKWKCFGSSESLSLDSQKGDSDILNSMMHIQA